MPVFDPDAALTTEELYAELATDLVERYAPAPVPLPAPDTYTDRQARAQQLVYDWLTATGGGIVASKSLSGVGSRSYTSDASQRVKNIIEETMGEWYTDGGSNVAYVGTFPH